MMQAQEIETERSSKIIVGLGNPGKQYERNRHNVGFMALDALAREKSGKWIFSGPLKICRIEIGSNEALLAQPLTYMNNSGPAIAELLARLQRGPQDMLLLFDDLNLPFGKIRIRERGSAGGHRGLESILNALQTDEFIRVRMGIGEGNMPKDKADFVLADFPPEKQTDLDDMIVKTGNVVTSILKDGVSKTMAIFNASN
jgi:PTH1 family peptidyl-tRNA hydrolase